MSAPLILEENEMKDFNGEIQYKGKVYKLVFNLNVMETIQAEYGSIDVWGDLTDGRAYSKEKYEKQGNAIPWEDLSDKDKAKFKREPDAKAVIFGFTEMLNEGIDISNEENGTDDKPLTLKQVGRMITEIGLAKATQTMNDTVIKSASSEEKNA